MTDDRHLPLEGAEPGKAVNETDSGGGTRKWLYMAAMVLTVCIAVSILAYITLETIQQADRKIETGAEKYAEASPNSRLFKKTLDDLLAGKSVHFCVDNLNPIRRNINAKRMILGLETYDRLGQYVKAEDDIDYEDLRAVIDPFLTEARTHYKVSQDTLYFAFLARDIMLYIFVHKDVFLIHDSDVSIMGKDSRSLKGYFMDALTVYDLLKRIQKDQLNEAGGFWKDADNANLFIVAMYCKARWATAGMDDTEAINATLQTLQANEFSMTGQQAYWLKALKKDLAAVKDDIHRIQVKPNRPDFVSTTWLR